MNRGLDRLGRLRLVAFDVDGVFTDGRFYLSDDGSETKAFHTQDGYGIRQLLLSGIAVAVISGRRSAAVDLASSLGVELSDCAYVGDDFPDLALLEAVGLSIAVANAVAAVQERCDYVTRKAGGFGAVREVCDLVIAARSSDG